MHRLLNTLRQHRHAFIVVALLTLVMTFPTIVYIFKTDVFWHPAGTSRDVYIKFWDIWHGKQFLAGQADALYHTEAMFYPEGLSLISHSMALPHIIVVNALNILLPVSNAFSLAWLLIIVLGALSAYVYLHWLFADKWIALFGAVIFGFSPSVIGHANHVNVALITTIPLAVYCFHRGINECRRQLVIAAGLLTGLTAAIGMYIFVCLLITLGFFVLALARARWREKAYWLNVALLALTVVLTSLWRVYALATGTESVIEMAAWAADAESHTDAISYIVNHHNPIFGRLIAAIAPIAESNQLSLSSYLGYLPLLLIGIGLFSRTSRRKMAPWACLCALFLILRLGSRLVVNGVAYPDILLPKYYLNQLLPVIFTPFREADHYMIGAVLPLAVLACYGLLALRTRFASLARPGLVLALIVIVAFEYYIPVQTDRVFPVGDGTISQERLTFLNWLDQQDGQIRLINLPMGRNHSKLYNLYQSFSGYPHAEGATSRTPDSAYDYIRANLLLNAWHQHRPISCEFVDRDEYLSGLAQLETDGFSHVVYHQGFGQADVVADSFREAEPAYADEYVSIFRLHDLRDSCTEEFSARYSFSRAYAHALQQLSILEEPHGVALVFPPSIRVRNSFMRNLQQFADIDRTLVTITSHEPSKIEIQRSDYLEAISIGDLEKEAALWLVNSPQAFDAEQTPAFQDWFRQRFHYCRRAHEAAGAVVDLYLQVDIPCSAMDESSALEVEYDGGVRLHNASFAVDDDLLHFYLAWTNATSNHYGFSLQFFDEDGNKALQYDNVIYHQLLSTYEIDISSLPAEDYSIQLIVYDFATQISQGGTISESGLRFPRELEIGRIEVTP